MTSKICIASIALISLTLFGCGKKDQKAAFTPPPAEVGVVEIKSESLPVTTELPGRLDAVRTAQVRARATGILLKRSFEEGSDVKEGDVLFEIDPAPLKANLDAAQAQLARAEATSAQAESKFKRFDELVKIHAISQQEFDDISALRLQTNADVQAAKAAVENAKLNLGYASVTAPISGRIGTAKVTEGALVSQTQATELATIQQLDPIYFDFTQSSTDALKLRRAFEGGKLESVATNETKVTLVLEDGTTYSEPGKLLFSDVTVDPSTGMITLRAEFPNPQHLLLPGMFGRVRIEQAINTQAITAPQRGIALGPSGNATAMVVTDDNKVEARAVKVSNAIGDKWVVTEGLKPGDKVIVEGLQKIRPGATVVPVPFNPNQTSDAKSGASQGK